VRLNPERQPRQAHILLLAVVVICWLLTDARPAFALCLAVLQARDRFLDHEQAASTGCARP
jgi:hypothetical protein